MKSKRKKSIRFRIGDHVQYSTGVDTFKATIIEDDSPMGSNGNHRFRISVPVDPDEPMIWHAREDELEPAPDPKTLPPPTKEQIIDYLIRYAGLRRMLRVDPPGGPMYQPRAWVCFSQSGLVTHTFAKERGMVGGGTVPAGALCFDRIIKSQVPEVVEFLEHFGLTKQEAEDVVQRVGTTKK
jgi:hypothetical protein